MELLPKTLFLCLALALTNGGPVPPNDTAVDEAALPDRCEGIEFDAVTPDEKGNTFYFKGGHLWNGFHGEAQLSNEFFKELDDIHHIGHVDAAFLMHNADNPGDHDHIYFFLDDKVFSYYNHTLEAGYPKEIQEDFPGVPSHLDSAVECPKGECMADSVLFFKGHDVHVYDITTKIVKIKTWAHLPVCTSAQRWLEHYYCFHGHNFTRFNPVTGEVSGSYPKDIRHYFMKCRDFGHGGNYQVPKCSEVKLDAITTDDAGKSYSFAGSMYMRLDTRSSGLHAFPITRAWKKISNGVDAVFSHADDMYFIKDDQVYIYKTAAHYTLIEGYPKTLKEELGIEGHVDAAFVCPNEHTVHVIQGNMIRYVDLIATPRAVTEYPLPLSGIDATLCDAEGIQLFKGSQHYKYESPMLLSMSRIAPHPLPITNALLGCRNE
ncbi:hemopexin isoform X1 [Anarrhichthys ocellatus]|uniref:hemopexin isoform X1 n=1 Tax=Anarrhichthys ocellatus TaxID=433405 RepID=UPI0012EECA8F|nr:hemopexin isoform X1 [Anarrhichthys ocellatus]